MPRVSRCKIFINGSRMPNVKSYKAGDEELAKAVKLMDGYDWIEVDPQYLFTFDDVPKRGVAPYNYKSALDGTAEVKVAIKGGGSDHYQECKILSKTDSGIDGENERVFTITVLAMDKDES